MDTVSSHSALFFCAYDVLPASCVSLWKSVEGMGSLQMDLLMAVSRHLGPLPQSPLSSLCPLFYFGSYFVPQADLSFPGAEVTDVHCHIWVHIQSSGVQ